MKKLMTLCLGLAAFAFSAVANDAEAAFDANSYANPEGKEISAYLRGEYLDVSTVESKLKSAGYTIVGEYNVIDKGTTILFTNDALKAQAAKPNRGFAALERAYVDNENKQITLTNPIYFGKAYMQDDYDDTVFYKELKNLAATFGELKASKDKLKFDNLTEYHFMFGMPYYEDAVELASAAQDSLIAKAKAYKGGKDVVFTLKISDNATIIGMKLDEKTSQFPKTIGLKNAVVLPYLVLIENGKAKALNAKYYIALSYPLLSMGEFMKISEVPDEVSTLLAKPFKE